MRELAGRDIRYSNLLSGLDQADMVADILVGLVASPRRISSKYFYDADGSKLFQEITELPEYYVTRTEMGLIARIAARLGPTLGELDVIEIGSGDCRKISILLDAVCGQGNGAVCYKALDVSEDALLESAVQIAHRYPGLTVHCIAADFLTQLGMVTSERRRLYCFFGSTIGNMSPSERSGFMRSVASQMSAGDLFLLGVDMVKPMAVMERAYNDRSDTTARFNKNILKAVNRLAGTDFQPDAFAHVAFFNQRESRIEMHLRATRDMIVRGPCFQTLIRKDEMIHTENSHKFTGGHISGMLSDAGLKTREIVTDEHGWFSLLLLSRADGHLRPADRVECR